MTASPKPSSLVLALAEAVKAGDYGALYALLAGHDDATKTLEVLTRIEAKLDRLLEERQR